MNGAGEETAARPSRVKKSLRLRGALKRLSRCSAPRTVPIKAVTVIVIAFSSIVQFACSARSGPDKLVPKVFEDAEFRGPRAGWLVTQRGDLLWTTDGGLAWHYVPGNSVDQFKRVSFIDETNGWALNSKAAVLRTRDGGQSWSTLGELEHSVDHQPGIDTKVRFVEDMHGWALDAFFVWATTDGGATWKRSSPSIRVDGLLATIHRGQFLSADQGWLSAARGALCQTSDGGLAWRTRRLARSKEDIGALFFINPTIGWAAEWPRCAIYHTTDAGETWQTQQSPLPNIGIASIHFLDENQGWAAGAWEPNGTRTPYRCVALLLHTEDGGRNWTILRK